VAGCGSPAGPAGSGTPLPTAADPVTFPLHGISMAPLLTNGDTVVADRAAYRVAGPDRGDVVLLAPPSGPGTAFVQRVIGLPGDLIKIDAGRVMLRPAGDRRDWQTLREPYVVNPWTERTDCCDALGLASSAASELLIPVGEYFTLGDNRDDANDSRSFGTVPLADIHAKCLERIRGGSTTWLYSTNLTLVAP
jgi:signal peptidase I